MGPRHYNYINVCPPGLFPFTATACRVGGGVLYGYALIVLLRVCLVNVTTLHLSQTWPPHRHTLSPTSFLCHALFHLSSSSFLFPSGNISSLKWKLKYVPLRGYTYCIMLSHCCRVLCQVCSVVFGYISL